MLTLTLTLTLSLQSTGRTAHMPLKPLIALVFLALATVAGQGVAQTAKDSREQIIDLLGRLPEIAPVRDQLMAQGFRGEKLALAE